MNLEQMKAVSLAATPGPWVTFSPNTHTYDTPDGTCVAAELLDNAQCLADAIHVSAIRENQRAKLKALEE